MAKGTIRTLLRVALGGIEMSVVAMLTALSPLSFLYFLERFIETHSGWDLALALLGVALTAASGLLLLTLIVYTVHACLESMGVDLAGIKVRDLILRMKEGKDEDT
jgi:hypothetical protein